MSNNALLEARGITRYFSSDFWNSRKFLAVDHVDVDVKKGECLGIIGESGCGKSTLARILCGLLTANDGSIRFQGETLNGKNAFQARRFRSQLQMIFQNPQQTFNPREKLIRAMMEPIRNFKLASTKEEGLELIRSMLETVGITQDQLQRYPHEISGGQAQRIAIARALMVNPQLVVADEITSMLDVSVQAQIVRLLLKEKEKRNLAVIFISHDLEVIQAVCESVIVMQQGRIVERGSAEQIFRNPKAEFTRFLLDSYIPV